MAAQIQQDHQMLGQNVYLPHRNSAEVMQSMTAVNEILDETRYLVYFVFDAYQTVYLKVQHPRWKDYLTFLLLQLAIPERTTPSLENRMQCVLGL